MDDIYIGEGKLHGKGVYASRDFQVGETVKNYNLQKISKEEYQNLNEEDKKSTHSFWGQMYLFPAPSRYTNHSANPNTKSDLERMCDIAIRPIKKGEMITTNATKEYKNEVRTFIESVNDSEVECFRWISGGYRNSRISFKLVESDRYQEVSVKRINGNFVILGQKH